MSDLPDVSTDETPQVTPISDILYWVTTLTPEQYDTAVATARNGAVARIKAPEKQAVQVKTSIYPKWLNRSIMGGIIALLLAFFIVSTAKQLEAVRDFVAPVTSSTGGLLQALVIVSLIFGGEIGAMLFGVAAGVMEHYKIVFRIFSGLSALLSILANWHVTALHASEYQGIAVYAWYVTFLSPIVVIVGTLLLETMALRSIAERIELRELTEKSETAYETGMVAYRVALDDVEQTEGFQKRYLPQAIKGMLERIKQNQIIFEEHPDVVRYAVYREIAARLFSYEAPEALPIRVTSVTPLRRNKRNAQLPARVTKPANETNAEQKLCAHCNTAPAKGNGTYCSDKCRVAAFRAKTKRNAEAQP